MRPLPRAVFTALLAVVFFVTGCASTKVGKGADPHALLNGACGTGHAIQSVTGSIWMNLNSKEAKGSFPASVQATAPDQVTLEVTNLLGGREALIQVAQGKYSIEVPANKQQAARKSEGQGSWGGIPLRWASDLFLGRVPCPNVAHPLSLQVADSGDLVAEGDGERFIYHFRQWGGKPWAETLHWESLGERAGQAVDFKFDDPEDKTGAPKKWEAKSSRGEVKVRWRDLQIKM